MTTAKEPLRDGTSPPLGVLAVARRVILKSIDDGVFSLAAQLGFYFLLALFPFLLLLTTLLPYVSSPGALETLRGFVEPLVPNSIYHFVFDSLSSIMTHKRRHGLLSFSVVTLLWSASGAFRSVVHGLNAAYGVEETRPFWRTRLNAMGLTIILGAMMVIGTSLLTFGKLLNAFAERHVPIPIPVWVAGRWTVALLFLVLTLDIIYYCAPNVRHPWRWFSPGAIAATPIWVAMSLGYSVYFSRFGRYERTYGDALAAIITLMLWFYFSGVVLLVGGELNSVLERTVFRDAVPLDRALSLTTRFWRRR
jgi:membrane protein